MGRSKEEFTRMRQTYINPLYEKVIESQMLEPQTKGNVKSKKKVTAHPSRNA